MMQKKMLHRDAKQIDNVPHVSILGGSTSAKDMVSKEARKWRNSRSPWHGSHDWRHGSHDWWHGSHDWWKGAKW